MPRNHTGPRAKAQAGIRNPFGLRNRTKEVEPHDLRVVFEADFRTTANDVEGANRRAPAHNNAIRADHHVAVPYMATITNVQVFYIQNRHTDAHASSDTKTAQMTIKWDLDH